MAFFDHYIIEKVVEINHSPDFINNVFAQNEFMNLCMKIFCIRVLGVINDMSLTVINNDVENIGREITNVRVRSELGTSECSGKLNFKLNWKKIPIHSKIPSGVKENSS